MIRTEQNEMQNRSKRFPALRGTVGANCYVLASHTPGNPETAALEPSRPFLGAVS